MKTAILLAVAGLASGASAQVFFGGGAGGAIPDNGGPGNPLSSSIVIGDTWQIADVNVNLFDLNHTWVGDLIITLSNGSTSVVMVDRPGVPEVSTVGYSWNLGGNYDFDDQAANGTWDSIGVQPTSFVLPGGAYQSENALSAFNGQSVAGTWTLTISDNAGADLGSLGSWGMTITEVPAPGALAVLGLAGLVAARRRR